MLCFSFVGAALSLPATSLAQASDPAAARALFQKARKAADTGDYTAACPKFAESYKLDPAVGTLLNIADCEQHLGQIATAWVTFQKALDQLSKGDDRRAIVEKAASSLEKRLPHLSIQLTSTVSKDSTVQRDGVQVGTSSLGMALPVDPGHHIVTVKAPGRQERRYDFDLVEAQSKELQCEPGDAETASPAAPSAQPVVPAKAPETGNAGSAVALTVASGAEPAPAAPNQPAGTDAQSMHRGMYIRIAGGAGYVSDSLSGTSKAGRNMSGTKYSGISSVPFDLAFGGTLGSCVLGGMMTAAFTTFGGSDEQTIGYIFLGPFVDFYPDLRGGSHFGAAIGLAGPLDNAPSSSSNNNSSGPGFGGYLFGGYDWWISRQWSFGASARLLMFSGADDFGVKHKAVFPQVVASFLYY